MVGEGVPANIAIEVNPYEKKPRKNRIVGGLGRPTNNQGIEASRCENNSNSNNQGMTTPRNPLGVIHLGKRIGVAEVEAPLGRLDWHTIVAEVLERMKKGARTLQLAELVVEEVEWNFPDYTTRTLPFIYRGMILLLQAVILLLFWTLPNPTTLDCLNRLYDCPPAPEIHPHLLQNDTHGTHSIEALCPNQLAPRQNQPHLVVHPKWGFDLVLPHEILLLPNVPAIAWSFRKIPIEASPNHLPLACVNPSRDLLRPHHWNATASNLPASENPPLLLV